MAASEMSLLGFLRIQEMFEALVDIRQIPGQFTWRNRTTKVTASDADIIARFLGQAHIADIIADDAKAVTYEAARIKFEANLIPNIKIGRTLTQEDIKRLEMISRNPVINNDSASFEAYFQNEAELLMLGLEMREESMIIGMMMDQFTYSRNGIILNLNWGMPAELKYTALYAWSDTVNGTPIADILNLRLIASSKYGKLYNRVSMSTSAFRLITKTAEFAAQIKNFFINTSQPVPSIPYQNINALKQLVGTILNMSIELYDARYPTQQPDGSAVVYAPYQPLGKVILSDSNDDNDPTKYDLATGIVTESVVGGMGKNNAFGRFGPSLGPFSYVTVGPDLNPPTTTFWAVERGMPRKKDLALTAVIDAGTVTDFITPGIAF